MKNGFSCKRGELVIRGYEYREDGNNKPIAIVSHAFMANKLTVKHYAKLLSGLGYAAFCFDFSGGCVALGKSDGKTTDMSVLTEVEDLMAVIEYAKGLEYTDSSDILLMGCSQGGFVSALAASKLKDEISKLILFYPALCIPDDAREGSMMMAKFDPQNIPPYIQCGPMKLGRKYVEDVIEIDPYEEIKSYEGDVLIVHGTADKIVHLDYSKRAEKVYRARECAKRVQLCEIEGGAHMFNKKHDKIAIDYLLEFLK